ncbi:hypothetical protein EXS72_01835 [Candidatus Pacearchaeota archaeon]|nr:hypothetical protein [Candidatus Pacearchaeota archaeon]
MNPLLQDFSAITNLPTWLLAIILTWTLIWKGLALWKASQRKSPIWFVVLLVVNTIGIFEILYYFLFSEMKLDDKKSKDKIKSMAKRPVRKNLTKQKAFIDN